MIVSFEHSSLTVAEGETATIAILYSIKNLDNPLTMTVSALDSTTTPDDYELAATSVELPASQEEAHGVATLALSANRDNLLTEGDETLLLRMVPPEGVQTPLHQEVAITITNAHASVCSRAGVLASPVEQVGIDGNLLNTTEIQLRLDARAAPRVWFEWETPYWRLYSHVLPKLEVNVVDWRIESSADATNHVMHIRWYGAFVARLRFRSPDGACEGEPALVCTHDGCELQS